jgi:hypothetical protein
MTGKLEQNKKNPAFSDMTLQLDGLSFKKDTEIKFEAQVDTNEGANPWVEKCTAKTIKV